MKTLSFTQEKHDDMKKGILLSALALLLAACEKEEKIVKDDGVVLCPVHWATSYLFSSNECGGHTAKIEGGTMLLEANIAGLNALVVAQCAGKIQYEAFSMQENFDATVEIAPAEVSDNTAFTFQINDPRFSGSYDFGSIYRSPHAVTVVRQADGYHFQLDAATQVTESFAPLPDFHHARLSIRRVQVEGRDDIALRAQVFDAEGKMLAEGETTSPITPGTLVPVFKLHVLYNAPDCLAAKWRILRYDYAGGGQQVSDDFHCNTLFQ